MCEIDGVVYALDSILLSDSDAIGNFSTINGTRDVSQLHLMLLPYNNFADAELCPASPFSPGAYPRAINGGKAMDIEPGYFLIVT